MLQEAEHARQGQLEPQTANFSEPAMAPILAFVTPEPNVPVRIYDAQFELRKDSKSLLANGAIAIGWLPNPRLVFEFGASYENLKFFLFSKDRQLVDPGGNFVCKLGRTVSRKRLWHDESEGFELELTTFERVSNSNLNCVIFHIVNFQGLNERTGESSARSVDSILLNAGGWRVRIETAEPRDVALEIDQGGFAITHVGIVEREDKQPFSSDDVTDLLEGLMYFLSFARGGWCWPCLHMGTNAAGNCWFRCDQPNELDQLSPPIFPFTADKDIITASFDGFLKFWVDSTWRKPIQRALSWYVESSRARSMETSVVAGQTALELIAWLQVVERQKALSADGFDKLSAGDRFKLLLNLQQIPVSFPPGSSQLRDYSSKRGWEDAPRAIAELRNSIVHPKKRKNLYEAPESVRDEARVLTLQLLASAILRLFGYVDELPEVFSLGR